MKLNNIDLNKLYVFHTVMKYGNYTAAAEKLNITKSAISQSISTLESQLNLQLFIRKGKKLLPSKAAQELFPKIDEYQNTITESINSLKSNKADLTGTVRIGAYLEFTKYKITDALKAFLDIHPNVQIKLRFDSPTRLQTLLEEDHIDLSFSIFPIKETKEIQSKKILKEELVLICPKSWQNKLTDLGSIISCPMIDYFEQNKTINNWIYFHFRKRLKRLPIKLYASTAEMVLESVKKEIGIGVVPHYLVDNDVQIVRPTEKQLTDYIWLNQFHGQYSNPAHEIFSTFITEWFN